MELQKFRNPFSVPPGRRWFFQTPGGKFIESLIGLDDCAIRVERAYIAEGLEAPKNAGELIQDFMCQSLPRGFCTGTPTISNPTWFDIKNSTDRMVKSAEKNRAAGPQMMQTIEKRAKACMACKQQDLHTCITCNGLLAAFDHFRKSRRTPYDRNLRVCRVSAGLLPIIIHLKPEHIPAIQGFEYPDGCWIKEELSNG